MAETTNAIGIKRKPKNIQFINKLSSRGSTMYRRNLEIILWQKGLNVMM